MAILRKQWHGAGIPFRSREHVGSFGVQVGGYWWGEDVDLSFSSGNEHKSFSHHITVDRNVSPLLTSIDSITFLSLSLPCVKQQRYGPYNDGYRGGYSNYGYGGGRVSDLYYGGGYNDYDRYGRRGYSSGRLSDQGKYYGPYQDGYGRGGGLVRSSSNYGDLYNNRGGYYGGGYYGGRSGRLSDQGKYYNDAYGYNDYGRSGYRRSGYSYGDNRYSGGLTPYYQNQYGRGSSTYKPLFGGKTYLNDYGYGDRSGYSPYYNPDRDAYYHLPQTSGERNSY